MELTHLYNVIAHMRAVRRMIHGPPTNSLRAKSECNILIKISGRDGQVVRSLDPCSKAPGFEITFRPVTKCEESIANSL